MTQAFDVLIVGGGQGGAQTALMLRHHGFAGSVAIVGEEPELPYDRPPLSKEYLAGERAWERLPFRTAEAWRKLQVGLLLGVRVVAVDAGAREVVTSDGVRLGYDRLVWAAGGTARRLACPGHALAGVHSVRNRADVDRIVADLPNVNRAVIVGGGYIGLEAAAVLAKLGKKVTVLEAEERVLARVAGAPLSEFLAAEHRAQGVDIRLKARVERIEGADGRVIAVRQAGDGLHVAQMVIVGIGISPAVEPLLAAGADGRNGVRVDRQCRTSLPGIFAIGDCAEHRNRFAGGRWVRLESVQNANDQANVVAQVIAGRDAEYSTVPWFWSNQYDLRLQTVGLSQDHDDIVLRGEPASRTFSLIYLRKRRIVAVDAVNATRDFAQGRAVVMAGVAAAPEMLTDISAPLKALMAPLSGRAGEKLVRGSSASRRRDMPFRHGRTRGT